MRPIDADALKDTLFQKHVHEGEELEPMLYLEDAMKVVDNAPTINAIPVEWLKKVRKDASEGDSLDVGIAEVLDMWEKEQEGV